MKIKVKVKMRERMKNESDYGQYCLKQINNDFKKINETKSFKDQIDVLIEVPYLINYWDMHYYEDNKETNLRLFKLKFAHIFNDADDNLFKEIFGVTSVKLADKLVNVTSQKDNEVLIDHIEIKRDKMFEQDKYSRYVIQPSHKRTDLIDTVKVLLDFKKKFQPNLT